MWKIRALSCGGGAGKTIAGLAEDCRYARAFPGSVGFIFEPNYPMVRRILFPTLERPELLGCPFPFTDNPLIECWSSRDMRLDWRNGSQLWFMTLEDPENAEGPNIDYAHLDEARLVRNFDTAWKVIIRRLRGSGRCKVPMRPSVWITTTPDTPGSELYNVIENPLTKSPTCNLYRWSIFENKTLTKDFIDEILRTHTGGLRDRFVYGRFAAVGGGSIPFDSSIHVRDQDHRELHSLTVGLDFGWTNPTAAILTGLDNDDRGYALDEIYETKMHSETLIKELLEWKKNYGSFSLICDPSSPATIDSLKIAGFQAKGYEHKRDESIRAFSQRFLVAGDGQPRAYVSKRCVNLVSELLEYRDDVKERDHAVDAFRYALPLKKLSSIGAFRFG